MRRIWGIAAMTWAAMVSATSAQAQRAAENAVNSAEDAFGVSIGNEAVGLYSSTSARGFNPQLAGNIRLDGLYFDQQSYAQGRLYADTTMHVGLSAQSYPFPAPTGIADTRLRRPTDRVSGSGGLQIGPYESTQLEGELSVPVIPGKLGAYASLSIVTTDLDWAGKYPRWDIGMLFHWTPSDAIDVVAFGQNQTGRGEDQPLIFTVGGAVPPQYDRRVFFGQHWAERYRIVNHSGFIVSASVFDDWLFRVGVFRSINDLVTDHIVFFRNVQPSGMGTLDILRSAENYDLSYSGEVRLSRTFIEGERQHTLHFAVRGRDAEHAFGGSNSVSFGAAQIGVFKDIPEPTYPAVTAAGLNHVSQITPGVSYIGRWLNLGEVSVGVQKSFYNGEVTPTGLAPTRTTSQPWLYNGTLAIYLGKNAALYGSYTKGLEESGVAPENAANRAEVLPVSMTEQLDAGLRYKLTPKLTLIAGVFEVKKPYFDRNAANVFTEIGSLSHRGVELSLSGQVAPGLTVVAGAMLLRARIEASAAVASFVAPVPIGKPNRNIRLNVQYGPAAWKGFSIDGQVSQDGPAYATRANTVKLDAITALDLGARYTFKMFGTSASLRAKVSNVTDTYKWTVATSGWYAPTAPRRYSMQVVTDF